MSTVIVCHPDHIEAIKNVACAGKAGGYSIAIYGNQICPKFRHERRKVWNFPRERFIEYEKRDEAWAIPLGFGNWAEIEVETDQPMFVVVDTMKLNQFEPMRF